MPLTRASWGAVLLISACGEAEAPSPGSPAVVTVPVGLATAMPASGSGIVAASGTVRFKRETALAFNTMGRVAAIGVDEGDRIVAGQPLARLDPTGIDASASAARAEAVRAIAEYQRLARLEGQGWVTRARLDEARATSAAARARVEQTGFDVRFARIAAPTAGVVLRRLREPGQMVMAGDPVVTIGELAGGYVLRVPLADRDLARVRLGQLARVTLPALGPEPVAARVSEIAARGDERTGTFQVELALPARPGLRSGLIGEARIAIGGVGAPGGKVSVPATAVFAARADEGFVYVHDAAAGAVRLRLVRLGPLGDRAIVVESGLKPGERVVRSGVDRLRDGAKVAVRG